MEQLALSAPHGHVMDLCEAAVLQRGQEVNRQVLEQAVQQRIGALEKKGRRSGPVRAAKAGKIAGRLNGKS
jgi:hypothetical protein